MDKIISLIRQKQQAAYNVSVTFVSQLAHVNVKRRPISVWSSPNWRFQSKRRDDTTTTTARVDEGKPCDTFFWLSFLGVWSHVFRLLLTRHKRRNCALLINYLRAAVSLTITSTSSQAEIPLMTVTIRQQQVSRMTWRQLDKWAHLYISQYKSFK